MIRRMFIVATCLIAAIPASGRAAPSVVTDIPPVQSLVAQVMGEAGTAALAASPGASPHHHAMRPSEARALARADIVVWIGPDLTPWLARAIPKLAPDAASVVLLDAPGTRRLRFGEEEDVASDDHGEPHDHTEERDSKAGHDHAPGEVDPHAWLDPDNAQVWLGAIADALGAADPDNAGLYAANAATARTELERLEAEIEATLAPVRGAAFVVRHDAYRYFGARFGVAAAAAVTEADDRGPGARRLARTREILGEVGAVCAFHEPREDLRLLRAAAEGTGARLAPLDPLGATLPPGPDLYARLLRGMAKAMAACLSGR